MDPIVSSLVNLGGLGVLSALLFKLHTKSLDVFREELKEERAQRDKHHESNADEFKGLRHKLSDLQQQVTNHHAAVNAVAGLKAAPVPVPVPAPEAR